MKNKKGISSGMQILRRWIAGDTDLQDEHTLRAQAGDDPFLRDAIEGIDAFPEGGHAERITRLKGQLRQRSRRRAMTPMFILRRAAAVLVIGLFGLGAWLVLRDTITDNDAGKSMAIQDTTAVPPAETELAEEETNTQAPGSLVPAVPRTEAAQPKPGEPGLPQVAPGRQTSSEEELSFTPQPPLADREADAGTPVTIAADTKKEKVVTSAPQATAMSTERKAEAPPSPLQAPSAQARLRTISGKVTDSKGEPVIGASVRIMGTNQGTVTDLDGAYQLNIPVDAQNVRLQISYTGYTVKTVDPGILERLNVTLNESADALSEVVVIGYAKKKSSRAASSAANSRTVQPSGGFAALEEYIQKNKRIPPQAAAQGISGEVEIQFSVTTQGKLRNFQTIRSLGFGCDEEAIRLLQSGPKWENKTGVEQKTSYMIGF